MGDFDPTTARCADDVFERGEQVCITYAPSRSMEGMVREIEARTGQRTDWCYQAGRAFVLTLGDAECVRAEIRALVKARRLPWAAYPSTEPVAP